MLSCACHTNDPDDTATRESENGTRQMYVLVNDKPLTLSHLVTRRVLRAFYTLLCFPSLPVSTEKYCSAVRVYVPLHLDAVRGPYHPYEPWILWKQTTAGNKSFLDVEKSTLYSRICKEKKKEERIRSIYQKLGKPTHSLSVVI